jgi:hypothetical protein
MGKGGKQIIVVKCLEIVFGDDDFSLAKLEEEEKALRRQ